MSGHLMGVYNRAPVEVERGEGSRLYAADGTVYLDCVMGISTNALGHAHPKLVQAVKDQAEKLWHVSNIFKIPGQEALADALCEKSFADVVFFTNSGTEGNVMALAGARVFAQRKGRTKATKVMVFHGGYHGGVLYFVSGGSPVNMPYEYVVAPYNDIEGTKALLAKHGEELFAVLLEPMQGSHGCLPGDVDFLKAVREETKARGITMIFDEVMTSRLSPGGLQAKHGVIPDMTTLGKYIGGGMSFGAFGGKREIMELFDPTKPDALPHAGTFNNNALTMAAGVAGYGEVYTAEAAKELNDRGDRIRERLNEICRKAGVAFQFSGIGSMMTAHATSRPIKTAADIATSNQDAKELFFFDMSAAGIWIARRGFVALNIMIGEAEGDRFVAAVEEFVSARKALLQPS